MNRAERRAAASGKQHEHRIIAVHEAGHAIARILTADAYGIPVEETVHNIVVQVGVATTYGPAFSVAIQRELQRYAEAQANGREHFTMPPVFGAMAVDDARKQGADVDGWISAKLFQIAMGPCAEAKLTGRDPFDVFYEGAECEGDRRDAVSYCMHYYGASEERAEQMFDEAVAKAATLLNQPDVWRAVLAVADLVPKRGSLPGSKIIPVAMAALTDADIKSDKIGDLADLRPPASDLLTCSSSSSGSARSESTGRRSRPRRGAPPSRASSPKC